MSDILQKTDKEILEEAKQLRSSYRLKRTIRYSKTRDHSVHAESVAEHVFGLFVLAHYFLAHEPAATPLNREKVIRMLLFHDFPEIKYGDVSTYNKTKEHEKRERSAAREVFGALPEPLAPLGLELWKEYEERKSPEAAFCYALDKLEPMFELLDPINERSVKDLRVTYEMHVANKYAAAKEYPVMLRFLDVLSADMKRRGIFWENE